MVIMFSGYHASRAD